MTKRTLLGYLLALHWELEREFCFTPGELKTLTVRDLLAMTRALAARLATCPGGDESVSTARANATAAYSHLRLDAIQG